MIQIVSGERFLRVGWRRLTLMSPFRKQQQSKGNSGEVVGQVAAESVALMFGVPIPGVGILGGKLGKKVLEEQHRRVSKALRAAERISGMSREDLEEQAENNPGSIPMLIRLLQLAGTNGHDRLLAAMGEAYGRAVTDPTQLEFEELLLVSLSGLEDLHITVMSYLEHQEERLSPEQVAEISNVRLEAVRFVLAGLLSRSLVEPPYGGFGGGEAWKLNESGLLVLRAVKEASAG